MDPESESRHKESSEFVNVVAAIIEKDGKFLVGRRKQDIHMGGKWALVGGKLESGESAEEALRREVKEELGIEVEVIRPFNVKEHTYPDGHSFRVHYFLCRIMSEPSNVAGHDELRWVTPEKLLELDALETDKDIFSLLQSGVNPNE